MMTTMTTMTTRAMSTSIDGRRGRGKERARGRMTTTTVEKVAGWRRRGRVRGVVGGGDDDVRVGKTVVGGGVGVGVGGVDARRRVGTTTGRARGRAARGRGATAADGDGDARVEGDVFERVVRFVSVRARAAWIAVVVVVAAAAASADDAAERRRRRRRRQDAEDGDDVVGNRARVSRIEGARANRVNECDANDASHGG